MVQPSQDSPTRPQPKLAPREPGTRQEAAKEAFLDVIYNARSMAAELVDDFRASDRFFKYKAGVLFLWALLIMTAMAVSCPATSEFDEPSNSLDAKVLVKKVGKLDGSFTAILIENSSGKDWGDTLLKLNNTYTHALADLQAGTKAVVQIDKFSGPGGSTPPPDLKVQKLEITCKRGHTEIDLTALEHQ
jgi:hypothetical protein